MCCSCFYDHIVSVAKKVNANQSTTNAAAHQLLTAPNHARTHDKQTHCWIKTNKDKHQKCNCHTCKNVESELIVLVDQVCGCAQAVIQNMFWLFAPTIVFPPDLEKRGRMCVNFKNIWQMRRGGCCCDCWQKRVWRQFGLTTWHRKKCVHQLHLSLSTILCVVVVFVHDNFLVFIQLLWTIVRLFDHLIWATVNGIMCVCSISISWHDCLDWHNVIGSNTPWRTVQ